MPAVSRTSIPEQGQLVEVHQRRYVVTEVRQSTLPPDPLAAYDPTPQHRVTLSQLMLPDFSGTERDQLARNRDNLRARWPRSPARSSVRPPPSALATPTPAPDCSRWR